MKAHCGFVSNSSTSSFIILGFVDNIPEDFATDEEEDAFHESHFLTEEAYIKGEQLARDRDGMFENKVLSIPELMAKAKKIAEENNVSLDEVKLFIGTTGC